MNIALSQKQKTNNNVCILTLKKKPNVQFIFYLYFLVLPLKKNTTIYYLYITLKC